MAATVVYIPPQQKKQREAPLTIERELAAYDSGSSSSGKQRARLRGVAAALVWFYLDAPAELQSKMKLAGSYSPAVFTRLVREPVADQRLLRIMYPEKRLKQEPAVVFLGRKSSEEFSQLLKGLSLIVKSLLDFKQTERRVVTTPDNESIKHKRTKGDRLAFQIATGGSTLADAIELLRFFLADTLFTLGLVWQNEETAGVQRRLVNNLDYLYEQAVQIGFDCGIAESSIQQALRNLMCESADAAPSSSVRTLQQREQEIAGVLDVFRRGKKPAKEAAAALGTDLPSRLAELFRYATCQSGDKLEQLLYTWGFRPDNNASPAQKQAYELIAAYAQYTLDDQVAVGRKVPPQDICTRASKKLRPETPVEIRTKLLTVQLASAEDELTFLSGGLEQLVKDHSTVTFKGVNRTVKSAFEGLVKLGLGTDNSYRLLRLLFNSQVRESQKGRSESETARQPQRTKLTGRF